jgi:hypothetical protein
MATVSAKGCPASFLLLAAALGRQPGNCRPGTVTASAKGSGLPSVLPLAAVPVRRNCQRGSVVRT